MQINMPTKFNVIFFMQKFHGTLCVVSMYCWMQLWTLKRLLHYLGCYTSEKSILQLLFHPFHVSAVAVVVIQ